MDRRFRARHVGTRIRELRVSRGLTQEQLADLIGIERTRVTEYETGRHEPTHPMLVRFATALDCEWHDFYLPSENDGAAA
jgi:transcriptional regulator with XRE-family HTH domain